MVRYVWVIKTGSPNTLLKSDYINRLRESTKYQFPWPFRKLVLFETFKFIEYAANYQL